MDDQVLMRVVHGVRGADEQAEARVEAEAVRVAVAIDRRALDQFHHQERAAPGIRSAVEATRDAGMLQVREDLPFTLEAAARVLVREGERQHFQRHLLRERAIGTFTCRAASASRSVRPRSQAWRASPQSSSASANRRSISSSRADVSCGMRERWFSAAAVQCRVESAVRSQARARGHSR
jgi:hypothetical protein